MEATTSANGKYTYDKKYFGKTLDVWINTAHKFNCESNKWKYMPLKKGAFGYDNLCVSLVKVFKYIKAKQDKDEDYIFDVDSLANRIHRGWIENYLYWRDNTPWKNKEFTYYKPAKAINDTRRNECADTDYNDLPQDEKDKDIIFANFIINSLKLECEN